MVPPIASLSRATRCSTAAPTVPASCRITWRHLLMQACLLATLTDPTAAQPRVLVLGCDGGDEATVASRLASTGRFSSVQSAGCSGVPSMAGYDAVLMYTNHAPPVPDVLGHALANFVDAGGGVVIATYAMTTTWTVGGRIFSAGYSPFPVAPPGTTPSGTLVPLRPHPVFNGVDTAALRYWSNSNSTTPTLAAGATLLATDANGIGLIAVNASGRVMANNFFPSTANQSDPELFKLLANQLVYVSPGYGSLDHVELSTDSASALTCAPVRFTVRACADPACLVPYRAGLSGQLALSGTGMVVNYPAGAAFTIAPGTSTTMLDAQVTSVGTVDVTATALSTAPAAAPAVQCGLGQAPSPTTSCSLAVAAAGLLPGVPHHRAETTQTLTVRAVRTADGAPQCVPAFANVSRDLRLRCAYGNPAAGTLPVRVAGQALNAAGSAAAACDGGGRVIRLAFDASGTATTTLQYADAGRVDLHASYTGTGADAGLAMTGSVGFVAAPSALGFSAITPGPIRAGSDFTATVTALNAGGAAMPNFGREGPAATVRLSHARASPTGPGASDGSFSGSLGGFANGSATAPALRWSEVGRIDLSATLDGGSYLGSDFGVSGSTGGAGAVGPFVPHHLDLAATPACGSFSYAGQPWQVTVTARNAAGTTTVNYDGSAATTSSHARRTTLAESGTPGPGSLAGAVIAASAFNAGIAQARPAYAFNAKETAPRTVVLRATDGDGASSAGAAEPGMPLRSGRLRLSNSFGKAGAALQVPVTAEYWSGAAWVINSADHCTSVPAAAVALSGQRSATGAASTAGTGASAVSLTAGRGVLWLAAPTPAGQGLTVDLAINLGSGPADQSCLAVHPPTTGAARPWLRSANGGCAPGADRDPAARASFGVYAPETRKLIHTRELFQ